MDDQELKESVLALVRTFGPNKTKIGRILGKSRNKIAEVLKELRENGEDIGDIDEDERREQQEFPAEIHNVEEKLFKEKQLEREKQAEKEKQLQAKVESLIDENKKISQRCSMLYRQQRSEGMQTVDMGARDAIINIMSNSKQPPQEFFEYVFSSRLDRLELEKKLFAKGVHVRILGDFMVMKNSIPSLEMDIAGIGNAKESEEAQQRGTSQADWMHNNARDMHVLLSIPLNHPRLSLFDETTVQMAWKDSKTLYTSVLPVLISNISTVKKEAKAYTLINKSLSDLIMLVSKMDVYLARYLGAVDEGYQ